MASAKRTTKDPWKLKKWFDVYAPESFGNVLIAETPAMESTMLPGRIVQCSLADLSGDPSDFKKQRLNLFFSINEVKGKEAKTSFVGHEITRDYERSVTRRHGVKMDTNNVVKSQDGKGIRVKTVASMTKGVSASQLKEIRIIIAKTLEKTASELTMDNFVQELLYGKLGAKIYKRAGKIYPLKTMIVRKSQILA